MDLELREALALSGDRDAALAQLLPGSEDHDYFRCLHAQHAGRLDEADALLQAWPERHGHTEAYNRLHARQLLCRVIAEPARAADDVRDWLGASHWHEAEVEEVDATRPTRIAEGAFDGARLLRQAVDHDSNLSQVTDDGLYELLDGSLDSARRRVLLGRLGHTPHPELVGLIADDLAIKNSGGFGSLAIHGQLTRDQLLALGERRPELHAHLGWVSAVVQRMVPARTAVDLDQDRDARHAYLETLWRFVADLPPAINSLKAHVLWHLLDTNRRRGLVADPDLVGAYLKLPRAAAYLAQDWIRQIDRAAVAQLGRDFRSVTGLPPAGDDEALVRDLIHERPELAEKFANWLDRAWLDREVATARLLSGDRDADRATLTLGPARAAALRERIDLAWCPHNPTRFGADQPIVLEADVKHVPELVVKVFRIDPLAYFQHHRRAVSTDLDLDGLAASHELVLRFTEPPVRRVRRRIELPMCGRPGTYVVDLIGNGTSSRVVVYKGRLRHTSRTGAAGHVVTIVDDGGRPRPDARAWIGEREYVPDANGTFVVPFSTKPGRTPMLLSAADIASVQDLDLRAEVPQLLTTFLLDREALTAGATARAIARVRLFVAQAPASVSLLKRATWDVTITDRHGVVTTKSQPLVLDDDDATVLEWPMGEDTAAVQLAVRGFVEIRSEQREQEVSDLRTFEVATIHRSNAIEALFLARTATGWVVSALGKTGEPRAQRPVTVGLIHRWSRMQLNLELATDARGRVELGALPGASRITVTLGAATQTWSTEDHLAASTIHATTASAVVIPLPPSRTADEVIRRLSIVESNGTPVRHPALDLEPLADGISIRGLPAGDYLARGPGVQQTITIVEARAEVAGTAFTPQEVVELSRRPPAITRLAADDGLRIELRGATSRTRVHVLATAFVSSLVETPPIGALRSPWRRTDASRGTSYVSGRELGDEYRYILERRNAKRYPGLLLDRPSLLLNPWARRSTKTDVAAARVGGAFAPAPAMAAGYGSGGRGGGSAPPGATEAYVSYDFLAEPPVVLANLVADADGVISVPRAQLGRAATVTIVVDDPAASMTRRVWLPEPALEPRDLRLKVALDPARPATQRKEIRPLRAGEQLVIENIGTAKVHLVDTLDRAHGYLLALRDDPTLREFAFVTRWQTLADAERRELYSKHACHELSLFLYFKDRAFFDTVIGPFLANKRTKTFLDHWLLDADLARYLEPAEYARLNAVERALLARRVDAGNELARSLADVVTVLPPDPLRDTRLIDALLGASTLDGDDSIAAAKSMAFEALEEVADKMEQERSSGYAPPPPPGAPMTRSAPPAPQAAPMKKAKGRARAERARDDDGDDRMMADLDAMEDAPPPMYRSADQTQEWAEHNWWHRTPADSDASMIVPNRIWRDLAAHRDGAFLSPGLGLATSSFAEAMCALAVTDLPFVAGAHEIVADGPRLTITAASHALAGSSQLVTGELVTGGAPLVVGMSYVRTDDRHAWVDGEQVDKYVEGPFATGVVYTCTVVLANPSSSRQRIAVLNQIPRGSIAVGGSRSTQTIDVVLEPYGTHGHEYAFYFPTAGSWGHFPVHVTRGGVIIAAAPARPLEVVSGGAQLDPKSWPHLSQRGSLDEVVQFLATANLAAIDLTRIAWRLRDRAGYDRLIEVLERRHAFEPTLWAYALLHRDPPRLRAWLRLLGARLLEAGPVLEMIGLDAEDLGGYEHLELAPLINARAHRLGPKLRILNDGLSAQYLRYLDLVAHRPTPTPEDLLAAATYLMAQDRLEDAVAALARVQPDAIADRLQHAYLAAYAACRTGDLAHARSLVEPWCEHPVDRWRHRFAALRAMLDEVEGAAPTIVDPRSRDQQHAELASKQPTFELGLDRDGIVIQSQHVASLELRFFEMDVELLFSRQPFVQSDVSRFSFIEPGHRERLEGLAPEHRLAWPASLRGKNVVVEAVSGGLRKAKVHYANDLSANVANQVGQLRVTRASDQLALPATYVKVYARRRGGELAFYKDGYTDLRGWFDYATLSTDDLDHVERFAILVCSDQAGAAILEATPPTR